MKKSIVSITVKTNVYKHEDGDAYNETVIFFREREGNASCEIYHVPMGHDSFWRAVRAMRKLGVRKY